MEFLKDAVYHKPTFEKTSEYELPKDISDWNEEILKDFFTQIPYIPKDAGVDVVINDVDENRGYAKGSVVVFFKTRKINFPIIVKDFKMFPFDIFCVTDGDKAAFINASERNVKTHLMTNEIGEIKNMYDYTLGQNLKTPGGVNPKPSVPLDQAYHDFVVQDQATMNIRKMSSLKNASVEDLEKLSVQLASNPDVAESFHDTTGDLKSQVVDLINEKRTVLKEKEQGSLDLTSAITAKKMLTVMDAEMFDVNNLTPIKPPSACEIRVYDYPTMDDFMQSGESAILRLEATKTGKPIAGIVLGYKSINDCCNQGCCPISINSDMSEEQKKKALREQIDQIFISADGNYYKIEYDYDKTGIKFYGSNISGLPGLIGKIIGSFKKDSADVDFYSFRQDNHNDGSDKVFNPNYLQNEGKISNNYGVDRARRYGHSLGNPDEGYQDSSILILYGAGDMWECTEVNGITKAMTVEGRKIYVGKTIAVIPANIASIQKVDGLNILTQPMYKMAVGGCSDIYLIPESSVILNRRLMKDINSNDIMTPAKPIKAAYEEQAINKVAVFLGAEGYNITGAPVESFKKIAGINHEMDTKTALVTLGVMGVSDTRGREILKTALDKGSVTVYGVNDNYLNPNVFQPLEKQAAKRETFRKIAEVLKTNLVKEASVIEDPEAVDTVLSLNFINEDNLMEYIQNIAAMRRIASKLSSMLIASRMGLADIDEGAARKAIDGLEKVVEGLEKVKMALGK